VATAVKELRRIDRRHPQAAELKNHAQDDSDFHFITESPENESSFKSMPSEDLTHDGVVVPGREN
jgi:hypothetical protein